MAIYSRDTFDMFARDQSIVGVRIKQGVPLVDADLNEMEDLRRFELRNLRRWFVGNGVPEGNDGFHIRPSGVANDVLIGGGDGTAVGAGRCLVDGLEAWLPSDTAFSAQEFADPVRAGEAGVAVVAMPTTPGAPRVDLYYLDVWEREIDSDEESQIIDPRIGIETARRRRLEWAARVVDETTGVPADDSVPGHRYLLLARVARSAGQDIIPAGAITDLRRRGLAVQSRATLDQIVLDAFGQNYTLGGDGQPLLVAGLREIMNAMLRSGRAAPILRGMVVDTNGPQSFPSSVVDANGDQWLFWLSGSNEIWFQRQLNGAWLAPELRRAVDQGTSVAVTATSDGVVWLFWGERTSTTQFDIRAQVFRGGAWESEFFVSVSAPNAFNSMVSVSANAADEVMVVWGRPNVTFFSRRYVGNPESPQAVVEVSNQFRAAPAVVALDDGSFHVLGLSALTTPADILQAAWDPGTSTWLAPAAVGTKDGGVPELAAEVDRFGGIWVLYANGTPTVVGRYLRSGFSPDPANLADVADLPRSPSAVRDTHGNIELYFRPQSLEEIHRLDLISEI